MEILHLLTLTILVVTIGYFSVEGIQSRSGTYRDSRFRSTRSRSNSYYTDNDNNVGDSEHCRLASTEQSGTPYSEAIATGHDVDGMPRYQTRFAGTNDYNPDPTVCYTTDSGTDNNGNLVTTLGHYICPRSASHSSEATKCCGTSTRQTCCKPQCSGANGGTALPSKAFIGVIAITAVFLNLEFKREQ